MSRIILISSFAAVLAAGTQNANAIESANQADWAQARQACADVGVDPASPASGQCVFDLAQSLWDKQYESER
jgi:hypothetical protein